MRLVLTLKRYESIGVADFTVTLEGAGDEGLTTVLDNLIKPALVALSYHPRSVDEAIPGANSWFAFDKKPTLGDSE